MGEVIPAKLSGHEGVQLEIALLKDVVHSGIEVVLLGLYQNEVRLVENDFA
ncbi:MAG: hypothetical protein F6K42_16190 [Leptolyngbya sp. SIO1D8]|nr:hypothetical protein [Leptolyngbya sp. SIO1D8]